jgi:phosphate uptake regulator
VASPALEDLGQDLAEMARLVRAQLTSALAAFFARDSRQAEKVIERDDQVDNLLGYIEDRCFERIAAAGADGDRARTRRVRGVLRVATNLEKLGDYATSIAEQTVHVARLRPGPPPFPLDDAARAALDALDEVVAAFAEASTEKAKHACGCERELDRCYREALAEAFRRLAAPDGDPPFVITHLFVAKFLERIGDSILNIGESTLFILTGERLKLHQYLHLEEALAAVSPAPAAGAPAAVDLHSIWGGISGARLERFSTGAGPPLVWKEGTARKIGEEVRQLAEWDRVSPGLVPHLEATVVGEGRESFVGQFLEGRLLRDIYLTARWDDKVRATRRLLETLRDIWLRTVRAEPPPVDYVRQIADRLPELHAMHPDLAPLRGAETRVFGIVHQSFAALLGAAAELEPGLAPPVTVRLHGDFNTNNVIYDAARDSIHFIDVHRSGPGDYLQDIGVFLVGNLRHPVQDAALRAELGELNGLVAAFAAEFARQVGDHAFEARLTLSQARSFVTSARLIGDPAFARDLYLRGIHLLEQVAAAKAG